MSGGPLDAEEGMGTAPDPPPLPPVVKWVALWGVGLVVNCVAVALAGPWAVLAIFGGVLIAMSIVGVQRDYRVERR